ncbi:hypothetical protein DPMN_173540 [Dreissena polymorpha]|uniref:Uncharacterized protein n=1 Tax=Dreissena polymorpha TaxID=45954 RepID=A0A9D4E5N8_DREPO|nr:hypothetical protein DPMN_173540 [Dreissena polymorpha]
MTSRSVYKPNADGRTDDGQRPILKPHLSNINKTNVFTKFHDDWTKNVTSRVFTSFLYYINIRKIRPPPAPGSHHDPVSKPIEILLGQTKFHEDRTRNVASTVFTNQMRTDGRTTDKDRYQKLT